MANPTRLERSRLPLGLLILASSSFAPLLWQVPAHSVPGFIEKVTKEVKNCVNGGCDPTPAIGREINNCINGGCDPTPTLGREIKNCVSGGCDPSLVLRDSVNPRQPLPGFNGCGSKDGIRIPCTKDYLDKSVGGLAVEGLESYPLYPYAKRPNGCSIEGTKPGSLDNFASLGHNYSFREACNQHDACYYTLGESPERCNSRFAENLANACTRGVQGRIRWNDVLSSGTLRSKAFMYCIQRARVVGSAVVAGGLPFPNNWFDRAQANQRNYLARVNEYVKCVRQRRVVGARMSSGGGLMSIPRPREVYDRQCIL
jgi:hypothetical protein